MDDLLYTNYYRRRLPHFTPNDKPYFITFNLHGAMPREVRAQLERRVIQFSAFDRVLDGAYDGPHWLAQPAIARVVFDSLLALRTTCLTLWTFTIMSNHVHLLLSLHPDMDLRRVMRQIKGPTAVVCNRVLGRTGAFWQEERYDRVMRWNETPATIRYILKNPVKARLCRYWTDWPYTYLDPNLEPIDRLPEDQPTRRGV